MKDTLFRLAAQVTRDDVKNLPKYDLKQANVSSVLQIVFGIGGAIALIIITLAGFKYIVAAGNPESTARAKNSIIYALIGLVVCATAYGIVTFVLGKI